VQPSANPAEFARILLSRLNAKQPVDLEAVAGALRLRIRGVNSTGFVGAMFPAEDGVGGLISFNGKIRESGRKRFTMAHEIGHYVLPDNFLAPSVCSSTDVGTWSSDNSLERAADIFATELLLPGEEVQRIVSENGVTITSAELIKSTFDVSFTAAAYRCVELTKDESALVVTVNGVIKHYKPSTSWRYRVFTNCALARYTMARELHDNPGTRELCGIVSAREWASESKYMEQGAKLWEESMYQIGYNTILSFLTVLN
jgi:Zn-dependent peptidase ImmA (M78 family)